MQSLSAVTVVVPGWPNTESRCRGFTLLEVVVAMGIMAVGLVGLVSFMIVLENMEAENGRATRSMFCVQEKMEQIRFEFASGKCPSRQGREYPEGGGLWGMERSWTIRPSPLEEGLEEIRVECSYQWRGRTKSKELLSLAAWSG